MLGFYDIGLNCFDRNSYCFVKFLKQEHKPNLMREKTNKFIQELLIASRIVAFSLNSCYIKCDQFNYLYFTNDIYGVMSDHFLISGNEYNPT